MCSLFASELFSRGDAVEAAAVKKQIDKLHSLEKISREVAEESRKIADGDALDGLKYAVKMAKGAEEVPDSGVLLFSEPEPLDAAEVKGILEAGEMIVDVDRPREYKDLDIERGSLASALDQYLQNPKHKS
jgi:hypothetical protein